MKSVNRFFGIPSRQWYKDPLYWGALGLAPLCWLVLTLLGVSSAGSELAIVTLLLVAFVSPVLEEIVFRGGIQEFLLRYDALAKIQFGISLANIVTSVLFAALHLISQPPLWSALIFFPSLVFGWARDRYQSLWPPIALHAFYNLGFVLLFSAN
ncbi:MAG: JDVT-CTERM system CAAX-type protease [Gammaproteobacteria bacterium]|nr:JDVT-CTERM system CAAX-type protease [Gammaproteobacteria bacterium]